MKRKKTGRLRAMLTQKSVLWSTLGFSVPHLLVLLCSVVIYSSPHTAAATNPLGDLLTRVTRNLPSGAFKDAILGAAGRATTSSAASRREGDPRPVYELDPLPDAAESDVVLQHDAGGPGSSPLLSEQDGGGGGGGEDRERGHAERKSADATARAGYGYATGHQMGGSLFGFDSVVFGLALAAFGAFLVQFIVNLVRNGRRRKRSLDGTEEHEHLLDMFTRWITPVIHGDYASIWNDLDPEREGVFKLIYRSLPDFDYLSDANSMLTQFAAMGEAMRNGFMENESLFPGNGGMLAKDVHRKLCQKYSLDKTMDRLHARISKYYWFALSHTGLMSWAEPYLKSIGHGLDERDCEEWPESEMRQSTGTSQSGDVFEAHYGGPGDVQRSTSPPEQDSKTRHPK